MISLDVELHLQVIGDTDLDAAGDRLMEALLRLEQTCGVADSAVSVDLSRRVVVVELIAQGRDYDEADNVALSTIRAAIHEVGGATPDWGVRSRRSELVPA